MSAIAAKSNANSQGRKDRPVAIWLLACCAMILAMAVIGAITRLTESGLSIMEWAPLSGALPPLSQAEWERLFALYQQTEEYRSVNAGMDLAEFRSIFWWEYVHRLWGRLIGLVFALPLLWFAVTGRLRRPLAYHLLGALLLGALQGALGWYMVASGFAEREDVSQYRLVAHLGLAIAIFAYLLWIALDLLETKSKPGFVDQPRLRMALLGLITLIAVTIASGGFVAGLNAGFTYNTFPLMDGDLFPAGYFDLSPWPINATENIIAVQFNHRLLGVAVVVTSLCLWLWSRRAAVGSAARRSFTWLGGMALLQVTLGIATLLLVVPVSLAALHQGCAIFLLGIALWCLHRLRRPSANTL